jgi:16S rRNA U516 pseudouridylate synthase RsuA-like enzyme
MKTFKVNYVMLNKPDSVYHAYQEADSEDHAKQLTQMHFDKSDIEIQIVGVILDYDSTTILDRVSDIIYNRSEEKQRQYGSFSEGMSRAAMIFNGMTGLDLEAEHVYKMLIALKLSRESFNKKYDNILDALAYMTQMYEHHKEDYDKTK